MKTNLELAEALERDGMTDELRSEIVAKLAENYAIAKSGDIKLFNALLVYLLRKSA